MLYFLLTHIVNPFLLLVVAIAVIQVMAWRRPDGHPRRTWLLTVLILTLYVYSTPVFSYFFAGTLEWGYPPMTQRPAHVEAIVTLSGGILPPNDVRPRARLAASSVSRCLRAAELYHAGDPCKVVVTGGKVYADRKGPTLANAMRDLLVMLGVKPSDILTEDQSRSTYENAKLTAPLLKQHNLTKIVLVTDATHLWRSVLCFAAQGVDVIPAGCRYRSTDFEWSLFTFLPSVGALKSNQAVFHEWLGLVWYKLKGRI